MVATPGRDADAPNRLSELLDVGYAKLANDPEYKGEPRRFTQADLDAAYQRGYDQGWHDNSDLSDYGYDDSF